MYNENYEDYIRNILGYPTQQPIYSQNNFMPNNTIKENLELEKYYPEIYKKIYPMIKKVCTEMKENLTKENLEKIAEEIYLSFENEENRNATSKARPESREENRSKNTLTLKDLIKILIIREILGNSKPPMKPPIMNPMPPFKPGFPTMPNQIMSRNDFYQNLYE